MVSPAGIAAEPLIRLGAFLGIFAIVALWEIAAPRQRAAFNRRPNASSLDREGKHA